MKISIDEPKGWSSTGLVDGIVFYPPDQSAFMAAFSVAGDPEQPLAEFMESYFEIDKVGNAKQINFSAIDALIGETRLVTVFGERNAVIGATYIGENALVFAAVADNATYWGDNHEIIAKLLRSIRPWSQADEKQLKPLQLKIITADERTTFDKLLGKGTKKGISAAQLRLLNRRYPDGEPQSGETIKLIQ